MKFFGGFLDVGLGLVCSKMSSASETDLDLMGWDLDAPMLSKPGLSSTAEPHPKTGPSSEPRPTARPSPSVMTRLILVMAWARTS